MEDNLSLGFYKKQQYLHSIASISGGLRHRCPIDSNRKKGYLNNYGTDRRRGGGMKYWELFFLTVGAGCFVGVIIQPASWLGVFAGIMSAWYGWTLHKKGGAK
jgi:hypothetical protein